jgi:rubrerythrin
MSITFNADEIFEMDEQIERSAAAFYREAAAKTSDRQMNDMFLNLAAMEDRHLRTFQEMHKGLSDQEKGRMTFDPDNEAVLYLQALADSKGFEGMRSPGQKLTGRESPRELLEIGISAEKNSVLYYVGLQDLVATETERARVETIIREEMRHLADLRGYLRKLEPEV